MSKFILPVDYTTLDWKKGEMKIVREQYIELQKGKCFWCKSLLSDDPPKKVTDREINWNLFPKGFLNHPVHLQHCHATGMTEGAVHAICNAVMWQDYGR